MKTFRKKERIKHKEINLRILMIVAVQMRS